MTKLSLNGVTTLSTGIMVALCAVFGILPNHQWHAVEWTLVFPASAASFPFVTLESSSTASQQPEGSLASSPSLASPSLLRPLTPALNQAAVITVMAGDDSVSQSQITKAAELIQSDSAQVIVTTLGRLPQGRTDIVLYSSQTAYKVAVSRAFPANQVTAALAQTAGFTWDHDICIPLYKYATTALLANTLTHELTHAVINEADLETSVPQWFNEGLAWYDGSEAEMKLDPNAVRLMDEELSEQVDEARDEGKLEPLDDDGDLLSDNLTYNREFQDYMVVHHIIETFGTEAIQALLFGDAKYPVNPASGAGSPNHAVLRP